MVLSGFEDPYVVKLSEFPSFPFFLPSEISSGFYNICSLFQLSSKNIQALGRMAKVKKPRRRAATMSRLRSRSMSVCDKNHLDDGGAR